MNSTQHERDRTVSRRSGRKGRGSPRSGGARAFAAPAAGAVLILLSGLVLLGWTLDSPVLKSVIPGLTPMGVLTAFGFIASGLALVTIGPPSAGPWRRRIGGALALLVTALGVLTLLEDLVGVGTNLDLALFPEAVRAAGLPNRGWPAPNTGLGFVLSGAALLLTCMSRATRAHVLAVAVALLSLLALVGYAYGVEPLYQVAALSPIALHTAAAFFVMAAGIVALRPDHGLGAVMTADDPAGLMSRRLLPTVILIPFVLGWLRIAGERAGLYGTAFGVSVMVIGTIVLITFTIGRLAGQLRRIDVERRYALDVVRESEERFRSLAQNAAEAIVTLDVEDRIVFANPAANRIFGYAGDEMLGMHFTSMMPPEYRELHRNGMAHYLATGDRNIRWDGIELPGLTSDGTVVPLEVTFSEHVREGERFFTGIMRDISERQRARERQEFLLEAGTTLAASLDYEETLRRVAEIAVPQLADWCTIDIVEDGGLRRIGVAHQDPARVEVAKELSRRYPVDPAAETGVPHVIRTGVAELFRDVSPEMIRNGPGDPAYRRALLSLEIRSVMIVPMHARGRTFGAITFIMAESGRRYREDDLTHARELASRAALAVDNARLFGESERARREVELVMESRARLMRGFSHDVKNPLGAADGYVELMLEGVMGDLTERQREGLQRARGSIRSALDLIDDLVELARAEAGQIEIAPRRIDLGTVTRELVDEYRARSEAKGLRVHVDVPDGVAVESDPARVRQVLSNLVSNAVKYTPGGGSLIVEVERREPEAWESGREQTPPFIDAPSPGATGWGVVCVRDTGPGIPPEKHAEIFQEFTRLAPGETEGAGLGLAISQRIAHALGGCIRLENRPDGGAAFSLWLPIGQEHAVVEP